MLLSRVLCPPPAPLRGTCPALALQQGALWGLGPSGLRFLVLVFLLSFVLFLFFFIFCWR